MGRKPQQHRMRKKSSKRTRSPRKGHFAGLVVYGLAFAVLGAGVALHKAVPFNDNSAHRQNANNEVLFKRQIPPRLAEVQSPENMVVAPIQSVSPSQVDTETGGRSGVQPPASPQVVPDPAERAGRPLNNRDLPTLVRSEEAATEAGEAQDAASAVVQPVRRVQPDVRYDPSWGVQSIEPVAVLQDQSPQLSVVAQSNTARVPVEPPGRNAIPLPIRNPTRGGRLRRAAGVGSINARKLPSVMNTAGGGQGVQQTPENILAGKGPAVVNQANRDTNKPTATGIIEPPLDVWSREQIDAALARCKVILADIDASAEPLAPIKRGPCGGAAPIRLSSIGANPPVTISPAATVNCEFAKALHSWVAGTLQVNARKLLGGPVTKIKTMASYACRKRYGRKTGKISEHAKANALDIGSFVIEGGAKVTVLSSWGLTLDDLAEQQAKQRAEDLARQEALVMVKSSNRLSTSKKGQGGVVSSPARASGSAAIAPAAKVALVKPGLKGHSLKRPRSGKLRQFDDTAATPETKFLHEIHAGACDVFGTVLGPEANEAHRNHFHYDLIERRHRAYCE